MAEGEFTIMISGADQHELEELEEACRLLRDDLAEIDGLELSDVVGEPPEEGTRSAIVYAVPLSFLVAYYGGKPVVGIYKDVSRILRDWSKRHPDKKAKMEFANGDRYEFTGYSADEITTIVPPRD